MRTLHTGGVRQRSVGVACRRDGVTEGHGGRAADAVKECLKLIDAHEDDEIWKRAGSGLHTTSSKRVFLSSMKFARTFSLPDKRELHGFGFTPKVDLALPEGDYVVVAYKAVSGNVVSTERVVMQREDDAWKLIGYHVNKNGQTSIK
jgi:hypothetical protein